MVVASIVAIINKAVTIANQAIKLLYSNLLKGKTTQKIVLVLNPRDGGSTWRLLKYATASRRPDITV